jgi:crossover junction endodeoxyribonuclease RuvC
VTPRILGIDPGTAVTGYGVVEPSSQGAGDLIECGVIRTNPRQELWHRLDALHDGVLQLIDKHHPDTMALESVFYAKNVRTTVVLAHARGVILLAGARAGLAIVEFPPATVKKVVSGAGGATKSQVAYMVQRLLNLKEPPTPNDAADGVAVALTFLLTRKP